ncbi:hypothetical protein [Microbacterium sp. GCS4]|uniref:hypothetical protein n=1 Tax=Microbacterium sp. GCS4 TaxID=1692239 RepID=UPI0006812BE8|nr:hypothetical protein [Microbacterium sp. GCS4]KNY06195.1 hypothetical protein AKH00_10380 [Microbacterium sp. GCS4]
MRSSIVYEGLIYAILGATLIVWIALLIQIWSSPTGEGVEPYEPHGTLFWAAGTLLTALGTSTAAAFGFGIHEVKTKLAAARNAGNTFTLGDEITTIGIPAVVSAIVYFVLGLLVFLTGAMPWGAGGFDALQVYGVTFIGWLAGALTLLKPAATD